MSLRASMKVRLCTLSGTLEKASVLRWLTYNCQENKKLFLLDEPNYCLQDIVVWVFFGTILPQFRLVYVQATGGCFAQIYLLSWTMVYFVCALFWAKYQRRRVECCLDCIIPTLAYKMAFVSLLFKRDFFEHENHGETVHGSNNDVLVWMKWTEVIDNKVNVTPYLTPYQWPAWHCSKCFAPITVAL